MARYDVYLVNALADGEKADLVARRLRALKFKVRYNKKRDHTTPTPKDYKDADNSQSVLVLWSKAACDPNKSDSDWVHAIAHHARSRDGVLMQVGLDKTVPDEPFSDDKRYALSGMGPRKLVNGYYELVEELGRRDGRKDLRAWIDLKSSDKDGKAAWQKAHPTDPLSVTSAPSKAPAKAPAQVVKKPSATAPKKTPKPVATTPVAAPPLTKPTPIKPPSVPVPSNDQLGTIMLSAVGIVIVGMLLLSAALSTSQGLPATAVGGVITLEEQCPAGQVPAYLLEDPAPVVLEPGPIIDDTGDD
jgi:hypothetical protein